MFKWITQAISRVKKNKRDIDVLKMRVRHLEHNIERTIENLGKNRSIEESNLRNRLDMVEETIERCNIYLKPEWRAEDEKCQI